MSFPYHAPVVGKEIESPILLGVLISLSEPHSIKMLSETADPDPYISNKTLLKSNEERLTLSRLEQPANKLDMVITFLISHEERSSDFNEEHRINIPSIIISLLVSNDDTSRLVSDEHSANIEYIIYACDVEKLSNVIDVRFVKSSNKPSVAIGA